ncbi:DUF4173 domain-containing protein [Ectobacillus antri]|jgi:hypothetical protein|uniref:DUF4173 domain-containing protein n=1 Tax=Ectobacillus antri TaxID=2486280 RepID=A0ABT6H6S9_9BACI|nr:DUF4173 domain-containing protein [Ectobacillus antri]MDG4657064.1 DUF4173 domain-containing protein [Ectobacillus antri]MDG5754166.1 DUF4173 domain-containing protein [Ectobacillus antri]
MENAQFKQNVVFFLLCIALGVLYEQAFFHSMIGISYLVYVVVFYWIFFWHFRSFPFVNKRIGLLLLGSIWLLAASYFLYDSPVFYGLNLLIIPVLMVVHSVIVTRHVSWHRPVFVLFILAKFLEAFSYFASTVSYSRRAMRQRMRGNTSHVGFRILTGLLLSLPLLFVVILLLSSADMRFSETLGRFPHWLRTLDIEIGIARSLVICVYVCVVFSFLQTLRKPEEVQVAQGKIIEKKWDAVIVSTILVSMNTIYILFVTLQFSYFFSGTLQGDLTYAEYARRGFFELVVVALINLLVVTSVVTWTKLIGKLKRFIQSMLTLFILMTGVMLISAFWRLALYEEAYGFTVLRVLPHTFMIFLGVIFAYTLAKVWLERISLLHFYLIASLVYYVLLNVVNINGFIVEKNLQRFEQTGKLDIAYLSTVSDEGISALISVYESNPDYPGLRDILLELQTQTVSKPSTWQSFHLSKTDVFERLKNLHVK